MLRNSKEIEVNQHNNTPTNDGFIETELNAETSSSQDTEKAESDTNDYQNSSESSQDEVELKAETSSSQDSQNTDANNDLSSSESEQDEKSQQATSGFVFGLLPNFMKSIINGIFGGLSSNESNEDGISIEVIEVVVPPLPILAHLVEEVHSDIHLLQMRQLILKAQQEVLAEMQQQDILKAKQEKLAEMQQMIAVKQQEVASELNQNEASEKFMQADLGRFYGKRMTFFCETGKPTQLVDVQAEKEKKNENDDQSSLRASM